MNNIFLSVIIPAYNEEKKLPRTLEQVFAFLAKQAYSSEVLVVENGSSDQTWPLVNQLTDSYPNLRALKNTARGKGLAIQRGMQEARGAWRFFCDADLSMPVEEISRFIPPARDCDIAIASREVPGAVRYNEPEYRHFTGRVFNRLIRWLTLPELHDTQCGFKCFRAEVAADLFKRQTLGGWAFDVELLVIARQRGYQICEIPIPWYYNDNSKINVLRDSWRMFLA
ncbi:MAG: glycosyltransferase family 2 protein, partial [Anaerolineales bacterium]|nr:glycosyltransferase family 2 protein [Anaerolineales bacterium]